MSTGVLLALHGQQEEDLVRTISAAQDLSVTRRCADVEELLAAALAGLGVLAVVDTESDLDRATVHRLNAAGVQVVVLVSGAEQSRYRSIGAEPLDPGVDVLARLRELASAGPAAKAPTSSANGTDAGQPPAAGAAGALGGPQLAGHPLQSRPGRLIAVTGPVGSPGRSTIAVNLAAELVEAGEQVLLIDADIWGASLAQILGVLGESAGLAAAIREADRGTLTGQTLAAVTSPVAPGLHLLAGLNRAHRWREVCSPSVDELWAQARGLADWVVVDTPTLVPEDDDGYPGGYGQSRNAVGHSALASADHVLVIGAGEPVGVERLVQTLLDLQDLIPLERRTVLVNRLRSSAAGPRPQDSVREALGRFAGVHDAVLVPDDRAVADKALLSGTTWAKAGPRSPARLAIQELTGRLGAPAPPRPGRRLRSRVRVG